MSAEILIAIISAVGSTFVLGFFGWLGRRALSDLRNHMLPNGGGSLYDQVKEAKDLAAKAVEIGVLNEAKLKQVETKVDALILSRIQ